MKSEFQQQQRIQLLSPGPFVSPSVIRIHHDPGMACSTSNLVMSGPSLTRVPLAEIPIARLPLLARTPARQPMKTGNSKHKRVRKTPEQVETLRFAYKDNPNWSKQDMDKLSRDTGLEEKIVYKWLWEQKRKDGVSLQTPFVSRSLAANPMTLLSPAPSPSQNGPHKLSSYEFITVTPASSPPPTPISAIAASPNPSPLPLRATTAPLRLPVNAYDNHNGGHPMYHSTQYLSGLAMEEAEVDTLDLLCGEELSNASSCSSASSSSSRRIATSLQASLRLAPPAVPKDPELHMLASAYNYNQPLMAPRNIFDCTNEESIDDTIAELTSWEGSDTPCSSDSQVSASSSQPSLPLESWTTSISPEVESSVNLPLSQNNDLQLDGFSPSHFSSIAELSHSQLSSGRRTLNRNPSDDIFGFLCTPPDVNPARQPATAPSILWDETAGEFRNL
eukprot:GILJ01015810.1.p1 GENE.GILJ01015810.1~~GILJ01015810.1.p1  ORF type:complete len:447 (+),score=56.65 GILJ01015810.1:117-1457(+)